jgi:uncharacterized membrane-anchored protein
MSRGLDDLVAAAAAEGLLPADAAASSEEKRPWPLVVLMGFGAWLAAVPLLIAIGLLFGNALTRAPAATAIGILLLGLAVLIFRANVPLFVEQLAFPALLAGGGALGFGLFHGLPPQVACATLALLAIAIGVLAGRNWVRAILGAVAAVLVVLACVPERAFNLDRATLPAFWIAWHVALGLWLLAERGEQLLADAGSVRAAAAIVALGGGWLLAVLAGLAWLAGMTFLAGAVFERNVATEIAQELARRQRSGGAHAVQGFVSAALAAAAAWRLGAAWRSLRQAWCAALAAVALVLAWFMPTLGGVLLALAFCLSGHRRILACAAALAIAWIVGAYYYALDDALSHKALVLFVAGGVLGAIGWWAIRESAARGGEEQLAPGDEGAADQGRSTRRWARSARSSGALAPAAIVASVVLTLAVANIGIWRNEDVIRNGRPVYIELAPVDPRSLMQGDYMALNFRVPMADNTERLLQWGRPLAIAQIDGRGVATIRRIHAAGAPLAADEVAIELTPKNGRWTVVTDAWFFRQGDGARWSAARFGEFRLLPDGRALLVGMADRELKPIR